MPTTITDQEDQFTISEVDPSIAIADTTEVFTVNDGDLALTVSEVSDSFAITEDTADTVTVADAPDANVFTFQEVLQSVTNNITNDNSVFTGIAAQDIGGHRIVVSIGSQIDYADNTTPAHSLIVTGLTTQAVLSGQSVNVTISGEVIEWSWSWTLNAPIFLGGTGLMTQIVPTTGFMLQVGFPTSATSMVVDIKTPITLSA